MRDGGHGDEIALGLYATEYGADSLEFGCIHTEIPITTNEDSCQAFGAVDYSFPSPLHLEKHANHTFCSSKHVLHQTPANAQRTPPNASPTLNPTTLVS